MPDRFYIPLLTAGQEQILIDDTEAHHLLHVLRARPGLMIEVFNGQGLSANAEVMECRRNEVAVALSQFQQTKQPQAKLRLAVALPKGDRARWLVEKATELGVSELIPLETQRSVKELNPKGIAKLEQYVAGACKQSGRNWLMPIKSALGFEAFCQQQRDASHPWGLCHFESDAESAGSFLNHTEDQIVTIAIGPEGGWSADEIQLAIQCHACCLMLGPNILRTETAALAVASLWSCRSQKFA